MKNQLRNLALLFSVTALFFFASCEQPASTPVDWGSAPPAEYIGTWENEVSIIMKNKTTLKIDGSGKVSFISETDMTEFITLLAKSGISEKELWAQMQEPSSDEYKKQSTGLSSSAIITFSSSSPYIMTMRDTRKFEDLLSDPSATLTVSTNGNTLIMTTKNFEAEKPDTVIELTKK